MFILFESLLLLFLILFNHCFNLLETTIFLIYCICHFFLFAHLSVYFSKTDYRNRNMASQRVECSLDYKLRPTFPVKVPFIDRPIIYIIYQYIMHIFLIVFLKSLLRSLDKQLKIKGYSNIYVLDWVGGSPIHQWP